MKDKEPIRRPDSDHGFNKHDELDRKIVLTLVIIVSIVAVIGVVVILLANWWLKGLN